MSTAAGLAWWHWWILAAVLAAAETLVPGAVAIWFAAAAAVVGALLWVLPLPWQWQLVLFGLLGFAAVFAWRRWRAEDRTDDAASALNQRGTQLVGQVFTLTEPMQDGSGRVRVGDGTWLAQGPDLPAGRRVRVIAVQGSALQVEAVD
jgi:inner membrane protein